MDVVRSKLELTLKFRVRGTVGLLIVYKGTIVFRFVSIFFVLFFRKKNEQIALNFKKLSGFFDMIFFLKTKNNRFITIIFFSGR